MERSLSQELTNLRDLLREDLRREFQLHEGRLHELVKLQATAAVAGPPSPPFAQKDPFPTDFEESELLAEVLPEGIPTPPRLGQKDPKEPTAWAIKADTGKFLSVTPDAHNMSSSQDLPGTVIATPTPSDAAAQPGDRKNQKRHSLLKQGKEKEEEFKEIRLKGGVFGAGDHKETRLDEDVYDVKNFYKTKGCTQAIARSDRFEKLTLLVISLNALYIGVDADQNTAATMLDAAWPYQVFDNLFCLYFSIELIIRFGAFESKRNCLRDRWFVFDALLVMLMVAETWVLTLVVLFIGGIGGGMPTGPLRLLRLLRLSRLVRLLREMPELLTLINGMRVAARAVSSALLLICLLNYVFGIVLLMFLGNIVEISDHFGTLGLCMWTLIFSGTFLDGMKDVVDLLRTLELHGYSWLLGWGMISIFSMYVLLTNVTVMNMLIGILCEVVSEVKREDEEGVAIDFMKEHLRTMLTDLDQDKNENISKKELQAVVEDERAQKVLSELQVKPEDVIDLTEYLFEEDEDAGREQEVTREELLEVILKIRGGRTISNQDIIDVRCDIRRIVQRQTGLVLREVNHLQKRMADMVQKMASMLPSHGTSSTRPG